jgi:hypothetical protein
MSRIRMAVEIRNESSSPLVWIHDEMRSGGWTRPWFPSRHPRIEPGDTVEWRAEGDFTLAPTTGCEGKVTYAVFGDPKREVSIYFNSPLVESQYGNTFRLFSPPGFFISHSGGQGHHARLLLRFRDTAKQSVKGFLPSVNGFQFSNSDWPADRDCMTVGYIWNRHLKSLTPVAALLGLGPVDDNWMPFTQADSGLCGGMVFAAIDYFKARQLPPDMATPPEERDPLWPYLRRRLLDSFDIDGTGHRWLAYSSPHYPNGDSGFAQFTGLTRGRSWVTYRDEWPRIRADLDDGRLSPIGLIQTNSLKVGENHTVLAYAYEQSGQHVTLWIYDPSIRDHPNSSHIDERDHLRLTFDVTHTSGEVHVSRHGYSSDKRVFAIIRLDGYRAQTPPDGRSLPIRLCLDRATGRRSGRLPADVGLRRPASLRQWRASL